MKVNDRVTVKTDGGPRRPGVVLAVEEFSEGTMYLVSLEDYPLGIWFFNESGHQDGIFVEKAEQDYLSRTGGTLPVRMSQRMLTKMPLVTLSVSRTT